MLNRKQQLLESQIVSVLEKYPRGITAFEISKILHIRKNEIETVLSEGMKCKKYERNFNLEWRIVSQSELEKKRIQENQKRELSEKLKNIVPSMRRQFVEEEKNNINNSGKKKRNKKKQEKPQSTLVFCPPSDRPYKPKSNKAADLFEFVIKRLADKCQYNPSILDPKMHTQWSGICFPSNLYKDAHTRSSNMSVIKSEYNPYFDGKLKFCFNVEAIHRDFPMFFENYKAKKGNIIDEISNAVKSEFEFSRKPQNQDKFRISGISIEPKTKKIYKIQLDLADDDQPHFYEGIKVQLILSGRKFYCEGLDYDFAKEILSVSCETEIPTGEKISGVIYMDTSFILDAMFQQVKDINLKNLKGLPIEKFLKNKTNTLKTYNDIQEYPDYLLKMLDKSQQSAFKACIKHDITFIWGPPGTGKSYTLANIIRALFTQKNESTLVCSISNIAVDQLLNKVVDVVEKESLKLKSGNFYRAGSTFDQRILDTDFLFLEDTKTKRLRKKLSTINKSIEELSSKQSKKETTSDAKVLTLKQQRIDTREELKKHTEKLISSSKIVFSTIANVMLASNLKTRVFDNLVVDEASMLSIPYLLAIGQHISKRIILVGDPQQLGPISISPNKLLRENVFNYCNVLKDNHSGLKQLLNQRRSHPNIVKLINDAFYRGQLESKQKENPKWVKKSPFAGKVVAVVNDIENDEVKYVGTTRRNFGTKDKVIQILEEYSLHKDKSFSIGIITPYRGQVKMYLGAIRDKWDGTGYWESIKVGTIHTFQGSECDLIIVDLVETHHVPIGRLFDYDIGEQLVNVALSRARHKLIVVGDTKRFYGGSGIAKVSPKVSNLLYNL